MSIEVKSIDTNQAKAELKKCPKIIRNDKNCQKCKLYGKCGWHKWLLDTSKCEHKIIHKVR